ncbi:hypothetical protein BAUCODRAFT_33235 [Baudoinia panamericana UAMH 10762]|uniref:DNA/RNA-binding protein Kin17 WH-like domain-containing protein n=1 Tax=Baudoinia panamericana (strain UAMH 10762) TaxID=717646 RepID=M2MLK1_BAUPA|nr:uncharacterized protein BAUCODRAFT_33235 [Baudoinia panamericana UAMH 10762]EMC97521.1 hypothetical protein BAUCODRAFT_33235 [Baudoinia panamericana UAMH 10762]
MPKAEVGSTKHLANKMKAKGLQRLRWYCQICAKQCRDENGFKQHTMSEGHVRAMLLVGEDPKKFINDYSNQFKRDFLQLLKTSHGEKKVSLNGFYQEYIRDKEHVHMNATKWPSLTEFAKYLGREGICRVEEGDRGLEVQWVDDSPEAVQRREDIKRKEKLAKGDESMESRLLEQQIKKAKEAAARTGRSENERPAEPLEVTQAEPVKVSLSLGGKVAPRTDNPAKPRAPDAPVAIDVFSAVENPPEPAAAERGTVADDAHNEDEVPAEEEQPPQAAPKMSLSLSGKAKQSNPLMKRNPLLGKKDAIVAPAEKKMSNAERIMREELERKRLADERRFGGGGKRQRLG